ncbi:hypothetical protein Q3G72_021072 [Acer saccharum]|nr:hypothetical protein Q3G72_021072 [Acer saccharum]
MTCYLAPSYSRRCLTGWQEAREEEYKEKKKVRRLEVGVLLRPPTSFPITFFFSSSLPPTLGGHRRLGRLVGPSCRLGEKPPWLVATQRLSG